MTHWTSCFHNILWFHLKTCIIFILKLWVSILDYLHQEGLA